MASWTKSNKIIEGVFQDLCIRNYVRNVYRCLSARWNRTAVNTKAVFTAGLMFFAGMLMLHNIIAVYAYFAMEPLYAGELLPYFVVVHLAELAGIAALLKVTL